MSSTTLPLILRRLAVAAALPLAACGDAIPAGPLDAATEAAQLAPDSPDALDLDATIRTLRRATERYQRIDRALADGFVLLHDCEVRPDEGPVGTVYVNLARLDATIDPAAPEALIYEPGTNGQLRLVGVEFAVPYAAWSDPAPPQFQGQTFQPEDEFGVFALHAWVWRQNPNGLFAESNPRVSCIE